MVERVKLLCASTERFGFQTYGASFPEGTDPYVFIRMQWKKENLYVVSNQVVIPGNTLMMQFTSELFFSCSDLNVDVLQLSFSFSKEFKMHLSFFLP